MKGLTFLSKKVYKRVRVWTLGGISPYKTLLSTPGVGGGAGIAWKVSFIISHTHMYLQQKANCNLKLFYLRQRNKNIVLGTKKGYLGLSKKTAEAYKFRELPDSIPLKMLNSCSLF